MFTYGFRIMMLMTMSFKLATTTCDSITASMLVSYARNEQKPTAMVFYGLCCSKAEQVQLYRKMTSTGYFVTVSIKEKSEFRMHEILIIADLDCTESMVLLKKAMQYKWMKSPLRWLVLRGASNASRDLDTRYQELKNFDMLTDSDLVIAERRENNSFEFIEVHRPSPTSPAMEILRGYWSAGIFNDTRIHRELYRRRRNLMKAPIIMSNFIIDTNNTKVHLLKEDRLNPHEDALSKICWSIVRMGLEMVNATAVCAFASSIGYRGADGKILPGMINDLITHEADLGTSCLITPDRLESIDYVSMISPISLRFIFRQPSLSYVSNIYVMPFSTGVWLSILVCLLTSAVTLLLTSKWEASTDKEITSSTGSKRLSGRAGDAFLFIMSALFQQGCDLEPKNTSGRAMTVILFAALMALYSAYSANIVVLLQAPSNAINNLQDLYNSKFTLAANDLIYSDFLFKREKEGLHRAIFEKKVAPPGGKKHYYHINEGVKRIRQGMFAFHSLTDPVYRRIEQTFLESEKCDLVEIDYSNEADPWLPMQKHSPYGELFRVVFKQIRETGLQNVVNKRMRISKPKCSGAMRSFTSVGIIEFYPAMMFMLYGFGLAVAILIVEIILHRALHRKREIKVFLH